MKIPEGEPQLIEVSKGTHKEFWTFQMLLDYVHSLPLETRRELYEAMKKAVRPEEKP